MKFLLTAINAKYIHSNPAVYSLKAYVDRSYPGIVSIAEYTINNHPDDILEDIYNRQPDVVGFSVYIWNIDIVKRILPELNKILPRVEIWLGGPEVSYNPEQLINEFPMITGIIVGEGEKTLEQLIARYEDNRCTSEDGMNDVNHGRILGRESGKSQNYLNMNDLPFFYENNMADFENRIIYYESSRGCPFRCSYCLSSIEKQTRFRDIDLVKNELSFFLKHKVPQVKFIDRTFNCNPERAYEIWKFINDNDNGVTNFHFEIAADILEESQLRLLQSMRPGLVQLEIGVQTTNKKTLEAVNRPTDIDRIRYITAELNHNHNIHIHLDLIAGLPYENYESFKNSFNQVYAMRPCQLQLGFLKVLKGSPMEKMVKEFNINYMSSAPYEVLSTNWISYEELRRLKAVCEMVEFYYNSAQFTQSIPLLEPEFETPFDLYLTLAQYYERNGLFIRTPARSKKYEILIDFATQHTHCNLQELRDALTLDFYLRERPKSKPQFGGTLPEGVSFDYEHRDPLTGNYIIFY